MEITHTELETFEKSFCDIENVSKFTYLKVENHNLKTDWSFIKNYENLKRLSISRCLINGDIFYSSLSQLKNLNEIIIDEDSYFLNLDLSKKTNFKLHSLKKYTFIFKSKKEINFDMDEPSSDNQTSGKMNFLSFPNFPDSIISLKEIEVQNYNDYLERNLDDEHSYQGNIFYNLNLNNLSRLKKLENINITDQQDEIYKNEKIISKIFSFSNDKKIKINNIFIKDIKSNLSKAKVLILDFDPNKFEYDVKDDLQISRDENNFETFIANYPSHRYYGYEEGRFRDLFDSAETFIIPCFKEFENYLESVDGFIDDFLVDFFQSKSLKNLKIIINNSDIKSSSLHYIIDLVKGKKHKKKIEINFSEYDKNQELNIEYWKYLFFFFHLNKNFEKKLFKTISTNLSQSYIETFIKKILFEKIKTILVIDDHSNSKTFKQLSNIEIPICPMEWPYIGDGFYTLDLDLSYDSLNHKSDEGFKNFFHDSLHWGHTYLPDNRFDDNEIYNYIIVKKEYLDNSKKIIFNNVENVSFQRIPESIKVEKDYDNYKDLKGKSFSFSPSINKDKIKKLYINDNLPFKISSLKDFENLELFSFNGHLDETEKEINIFPEMTKLKELNYSVNYPFLKTQELMFKNFEKSKNLESINLGIGYSSKRDESRWISNDVDVANLESLELLKELEFNGLPQSNIKNLKGLKNLEKLRIINPFMITESYSPDDGNYDQPLTENEFKFLNQSKKLKELEIYFPRMGDEKTNINFDKFLRFLNPYITSLKFMLSLDNKQRNTAHALIKSTLKNFNNIEEIDFTIWAGDDVPSLIYDKRKKDGEEKAEIAYEKRIQDPVIIDFEKFLKLKKLKRLKIDFNYHIGVKLNNISALKKFKDINLDFKDRLLEHKELEKIFYDTATKRQIFLYDYSKKKKKICGTYDLDKKNKKEYNNLPMEDDEEQNNLEIRGQKLWRFLLKKFDN